MMCRYHEIHGFRDFDDPHQGSHETSVSGLDMIQEMHGKGLPDSHDRLREWYRGRLCPVTSRKWPIQDQLPRMFEPEMERKIKPRAGDGEETRGFRE
jgi:uncharacterized protein YbaR (Trm112 family)